MKKGFINLLFVKSVRISLVICLITIMMVIPRYAQALKQNGLEADQTFFTQNVMDLIAVTLSKRLFSELRDKRGLVYHASSSYQTKVGPSAITGIAVAAPENYNMVRDGMVAEFKKICDEPVSVKELEAAKKYFKGTFMMSQGTSVVQGESMGMFELLGYGYKNVDLYPELIEKVTPEDIQRVARKYFKPVVAPEGSVEE